MDSDAPSLNEIGESRWSSNRRIRHAHLLRVLERMRSIDDQETYDALDGFVDALLADGVAPEATVIAVKEAIGRSTCLSRFELSMRERVRSSLVAACIERYYEARAASGEPARTARPERHLRVEPRGDASA